LALRIQGKKPIEEINASLTYYESKPEPQTVMMVSRKIEASCFSVFIVIGKTPIIYDYFLIGDCWYNV
tara:strand:- start:146 stop:349 length:204 start_codon:yes stop_codon:yes gene_type:complete